MKDLFRKLAAKTSALMGTPWAFLAAVLLIAAWGLTGPVFHYSDTWQLVVNTATTIVTFLMVFLIQNTQNRDAKAIHLKLDELLRALNSARTGLVDLEEMTDDELEQLQQEFRRLRKARVPLVDQAEDAVERELDSRDQPEQARAAGDPAAAHSQ